MSMLPSSRTIRIFFSYDTLSTPDKEAFKHLTDHLSNLRRQRPTLSFSDSAVSAGSEVTRFVEDRLNRANLIVLLISPDFLASKHCYDFEMKRAVARSDAGEARVIPVLLRSADWKIPPLDRYSPLPSNQEPISLWSDSDSAFLDVVRGIREVVEELDAQPDRAHQTTRYMPIYNPPYNHNSFFTNRDEPLSTIASSFASAPAHQTPILALNGLPGIGKTHVALEYSYRSSSTYNSIIWLNASSRAVLGKDVRSLVEQFSLPNEYHEDELQLFSAFRQWLQDQSSWLLVLDQIDDVVLIDLVVPLQSRGHVLLTTRMQALGKRASPILITSMDIDGSTLFLLRRAKILAAGAQLQQVSAKVVQEANAIAQVVGGYPLALDQAGAFLEEKGCSLTTYLRLYQKQGTKLLNEGEQQINDHQKSVINTLMLAIEQVTQKDALNLELLHLLAFLYPDAIPEGLLIDGASKLRKPLQTFAKNPLLLQDALADLRRFSLVHNSIDREVLQIHRVVQDVLIDRLTRGQQRQWARQVVHLVNFVFPEVHFDTWATCELYLPQAKRCADLIDKFQLTFIEGASLLERLGNYLSQRGFYIDAETYLLQSLHLYENQLHTNSSDLAQTLNSLGLLYSRQAQFYKAESHHQRALELREHTLDADHPKVAESLHNLALVYAERGEYQQAEQIYLRVLSIEEQTKGANHPDVASTLNNLGLTYYKQELYFQAETVYKRALAIYEISSDTNHPNLIYPLDGLGALAEIRGNYQQAEGFYQRALAIAKNAFGDKHIEIAHSINKVADIALAQGNDARAEEFYQQALSIGEKVLRPGHPDIALFLSNLAFLANKQTQDQKAEPLYRQALDIYEQALGSEHPDTILVREQYNALLKRMNRDFS